VTADHHPDQPYATAKQKKNKVEKPSQTGFYLKKLNRTKTSRFEPVLVFFKKKI